MKSYISSTELSEHVLQRVKCNEFKWHWRNLTYNTGLTWGVIEANPDKPWDWIGLSRNSCVTWEIVSSNLDKPWDLCCLSRYPCNPDKPWDWYSLVDNNSIKRYPEVRGLRFSPDTSTYSDRSSTRTIARLHCMELLGQGRPLPFCRGCVLLMGYKKT